MVFILLILFIMLCPIISTTCIHANNFNASVVTVLYLFVFFKWCYYLKCWCLDWFLSFLLHSPGSSDTTSLNAELKVELHKLEILRKNKTKTSPLIENRLLTLKGLSFSPTLFKVLLRPENPYTPPKEDSKFNEIWTWTHPLPTPRPIHPLCRRLQWDWVDSLGTRGGGRGRGKMRNCLTHHETSERKHKMATWKMTNYTYVVPFFIYIIFFSFYHFVVSTMKLHALAGRSRN